MTILDSDVVIDLSRGVSVATEWLRRLGAEVVAIPVYVSLELISGTRSVREQRTIVKELSRFRTIWPSAQACQAAIGKFARYHHSSAIGILDVLIAHTSMALNLPLHTFNQKHFDVIPGLRTIRPCKR